MRLTNFHRDTFVRAVDCDTPDVKFPKASEIQHMCLLSMNPKLRAVWEDENLRKYLNKHYCEYASDMSASQRYVFEGDVKVSDILKDIISADAARKEAINKVRLVANRCTTLKQLEEALPELVEYMPTDTGKPSSKAVPMVLNVFEDLKKAGFPK